MILTSLGVITRIVSNSFLNVFQKILTSNGTKSSVVNFYTYLGLSIVSLFLCQFFDFSFTKELVLNFLVMGLLGALGNYFIIKALSEGELSSLAPINAYKPIVALLIAFLYLHEVPSITASIGILLVILGSYLLKKTSVSTSKLAVFYRILALIFSGCEAVFIKKIILITNIPASFALWTFSGFLFSCIFLLISKHKPIVTSAKHQILLILSVGVMQYSTNFVFANMNVSYALALFQLSTLFSVFLGANIFHEKNIKSKLLICFVMILGAIIIILD